MSHPTVPYSTGNLEKFWWRESEEGGVSLSKKTGKVARGLINPCEGSETLCLPSLTHLCRCTVLGAVLRMGSSWECSRHKGWGRGG